MGRGQQRGGTYHEKKKGKTLYACGGCVKSSRAYGFSQFDGRQIAQDKKRKGNVVGWSTEKMEEIKQPVVQRHSGYGELEDHKSRGDRRCFGK